MWWKAGVNFVVVLENTGVICSWSMVSVYRSGCYKVNSWNWWMTLQSSDCLQASLHVHRRLSGCCSGTVRTTWNWTTVEMTMAFRRYPSSFISKDHQFSLFQRPEIRDEHQFDPQTDAAEDVIPKPSGSVCHRSCRSKATHRHCPVHIHHSLVWRSDETGHK